MNWKVRGRERGREGGRKEVKRGERALHVFSYPGLYSLVHMKPLSRI